MGRCQVAYTPCCLGIRGVRIARFPHPTIPPCQHLSFPPVRAGQSQTVVVVEPPLNYKMVFDGPTNGGPSRKLVSPVSMALFPHARGASVCAQLFEHYVAEDGLCYHL